MGRRSIRLDDFVPKIGYACVRINASSTPYGRYILLKVVTAYRQLQHLCTLQCESMVALSR